MDAVDSIEEGALVVLSVDSVSRLAALDVPVDCVATIFELAAVFGAFVVDDNVWSLVNPLSLLVMEEDAGFVVLGRSNGVGCGSDGVVVVGFWFPIPVPSVKILENDVVVLEVKDSSCSEAAPGPLPKAGTDPICFEVLALTMLLPEE